MGTTRQLTNQGGLFPRWSPDGKFIAHPSSVTTLDQSISRLYVVHMKHVTASEARKNWFTLLDEAVKGEVIAIQRNDKKLILKLEKKKPAAPSYKGLIDFPDADEADIWGWEWKGPGNLVPKARRTSKR